MSPTNPPDGAGQQTLIPAGTTLTVTTVETINPANFDPGQEYGAVMESPVVENGNVIIPKGADVTLKPIFYSFLLHE
jgi:hypothetical protein